MKDDRIHLLEDNPGDMLLTLKALKKNSTNNEVMVARDGAEALDPLLGTGVLLNLEPLHPRLPKPNGFGALRRLQGDDRTRRLPVVHFTPREGERETLDGAAGTAAEPWLPESVDFERFLGNVRRIASLRQHVSGLHLCAGRVCNGRHDDHEDEESTSHPGDLGCDHARVAQRLLSSLSRCGHRHVGAQDLRLYEKSVSGATREVSKRRATSSRARRGCFGNGDASRKCRVQNSRRRGRVGASHSCVGRNPIDGGDSLEEVAEDERLRRWL